jgi:uncharacterized membrane protein SirB2
VNNLQRPDGWDIKPTLLLKKSDIERKWFRLLPHIFPTQIPVSAIIAVYQIPHPPFSLQMLFCASTK